MTPGTLGTARRRCDCDRRVGNSRRINDCWFNGLCRKSGSRSRLNNPDRPYQFIVGSGLIDGGNVRARDLRHQKPRVIAPVGARILLQQAIDRLAALAKLLELVFRVSHPVESGVEVLFVWISRDVFVELCLRPGPVAIGDQIARAAKDSGRIGLRGLGGALGVGVLGDCWL